MLKPHHLELFYYVAKHGGISAAARQMPYSLCQPAISGQMADFERELGTRLFERKPFRLTAAGRCLNDYLQPFGDGLGRLEQALRGEPAQHISLAIDDVIGPEFFAVVFRAGAPLPPDTCFVLRTGPPAAMEAWLHGREAQLIITTTECRIPGVRSRILARPGLRLWVHRKAKIFSPGHFWRQKRIAEPLICPAAGAVPRSFARGLQGLHVEWPVGIHADSAAVMMNLVAAGHGVGLGLEPPARARHAQVRALPLTGFDPVPLVAFWRPPTAPWFDPLLAAAHATARKLWPSGPAGGAGR